MKSSGIQNCGSDIIQSSPPKETVRIGYFSSWNANRECGVHEIDTKAYTHIHFAFANVTSDFKVDISGVPDEFERFKKLTGVKKIISFGGWDFSTNAGTFRIIREAVKPANRNTFRDNVVNFVNDHGLDGFDLDWEYPGAPDIPGVPPSGNPQEGLNYYKFLSIANSALGSGKSVSFAAPASYWYLKAFPIELMAKSLDYVVYMTYDLHGQWDYNNKWASSGCPDGNCLRSHVNLTETILSLSMITKAGIPSNKVAVGITSYGRSFHMAHAGCDGPDCKFTGSATHSDAKVGMCTNTGGYIADAEIKDIINLYPENIKQWIDTSNSNILVYNDVEWVAYMDKDIKDYRKKVYDVFHFAGTSDWALDLQEFQETKDVIPYEPPREMGICNQAYDTIQAIKADMDNIPWNCKHQYIVSARQKQLTAALKQYNDIFNDGYSHNDTGDIKRCSFHNISIACPPKHPYDQAFNIYLLPKDDNKILNHLDKDFGVSPDAVYAEDWHYGPCLPEQDKICSCSKWGHLIGRKAIKPDWKLPDPRKYVEQALANITIINDFLEEATTAMDMGIFIDSATDTVDATALPVLMIVAAVDSMEQIKEAGEKIEEEERKNIILLALTAVFFVIPGLGEALGAVSGIAAIARLATIIAEAGGAGLGVYNIVNDPKSAPLEIFSMLMGGLAVKGAARGWIGEAAGMRRAMDATHVKGMGRILSDGLGDVASVLKYCKKT
ncbi:hypothetical protein J3458_016500 [Metarhizium acridum]|uniref:uncharacterized protein n=1 Tax=Metarhizium acridum TaxID=92637 RepID=UPI001C6D2873|nr:hypothetical protein J3458_016500 [Metarhizium acridum]